MYEKKCVLALFCGDFIYAGGLLWWNEACFETVANAVAAGRAEGTVANINAGIRAEDRHNSGNKILS